MNNTDNSRDIVSLITACSEAMIHKLLLNANKGGWLNIPFDELRQKLFDEYIEMSIELNNLHFNTIKEKEKDYLESIKYEAADISNFAGMIIHKCDILLGKFS